MEMTIIEVKEQRSKRDWLHHVEFEGLTVILSVFSTGRNSPLPHEKQLSMSCLPGSQLVIEKS
jgi:hypothetical protein